MTTIDVTAIILAVIGMMSGWFSWWLDRKKHKEEVKALKVEINKNELDSEYVFRREVLGTDWRTAERDH